MAVSPAFCSNHIDEDLLLEQTEAAENLPLIFYMLLTAQYTKPT